MLDAFSPGHLAGVSGAETLPFICRKGFFVPDEIPVIGICGIGIGSGILIWFGPLVDSWGILVDVGAC